MSSSEKAKLLEDAAQRALAELAGITGAESYGAAICGAQAILAGALDSVGAPGTCEHGKRPGAWCEGCAAKRRALRARET